MGTPYTIRMRVPSGKSEFKDLVYGKISFENEDLDD